MYKGKINSDKRRNVHNEAYYTNQRQFFNDSVAPYMQKPRTLRTDPKSKKKKKILCLNYNSYIFLS